MSSQRMGLSWHTRRQHKLSIYLLNVDLTPSKSCKLFESKLITLVLVEMVYIQSELIINVPFLFYIS